jgi:hypothetical protein
MISHNKQKRYTMEEEELRTKQWYGSLIQEIDSNINTNGSRAITGAKLNSVLNDMVSALGSNMLFGGVVTPSSSKDASSETPVFYFAPTAGTYTNLGNIVVANGEFAFIYADLNENWQKMSWSIDLDDVYVKPDGGIPSTDLATDVQTSLGLAKTAIQASEKGANNGVATLDSSGKVPQSQLPSYVDDVLEYANLASFPVTGESGKIYVALDTNKTYRWSGSTYVEIAQGLALGETSSTAFAGNRGKAIEDKIPSNASSSNKLATMADLPDETTDYGDLTNKPQINSVTLSGNKSASDLGLATAAQGAKADTAYQKPQTGIPSTDLASGVQTSLGKADTAVQQVTVGTTTTGAAGTNASVANSGTSTAPVLDFTIPRGADGADAVNPFKGWWPDLATLKAAITAIPGDYAYIIPAVSTDPVAIYEYDSTATTDNYWSDSGRTFNPANNQEFASGEDLNTVHIQDNLDTDVATDVLSAKQGYNLNKKATESMVAKLEDADISSYAIINYLISVSNPTKWGSTPDRKHIIISVADIVSVVVKANASNVTYLAWLTSDAAPSAGGQTPILSGTTLITLNSGHEFFADVPNGATYLYVSLGQKGNGVYPYQPEYVKLKHLSICDDFEKASEYSVLQSKLGAGMNSTINHIIDNVGVKIEFEYVNTYNLKIADLSGNLVTSSSGKSNDYDISAVKIDGSFYADIYNVSESAERLPIAFYGDNGFISGVKPTEAYSTKITNYMLTVPDGTKIIRIYGRPEGSFNAPPALRFLSTDYVDVQQLKNNVDTLQEEVENISSSEFQIPQIYETPIRRKDVTTPLRMLCFGSSWFRNSWFYLNKLINDAGISAEIHCYYMGHSQFHEWIDLYNNDLTPFAGDEASRSAIKYISLNGADWTLSTYSSSGTYNAQSYRDDFYNDLIAGDWDIIAFQQGARQAPYWDLYWKDYWSELVSIVRRNCGIDTVIAFNSTWAPAVQDSAELAPWPATREGQAGWQQANWNNTTKFMSLSGIHNVSPNGKLISLLRSSDLNTNTDLADDGLHINNGRGMYGLAACMYQTYIAPMYGIDINDVDWLPTSSSQKITGYAYDEITSVQADEIKAFVKLALSKRFAF